MGAHRGPARRVEHFEQRPPGPGEHSVLGSRNKSTPPIQMRFGDKRVRQRVSVSHRSQRTVGMRLIFFATAMMATSFQPRGTFPRFPGPAPPPARGRRTSTTSGFARRHGGRGSPFGSTDRVARSASSCLGPHRRQQPFSGPAKREAFRSLSGGEQHRRLGVHEIGKVRHLGTAQSKPADARPAQGNLRRFCCEEIAGSD